MRFFRGKLYFVLTKPKKMNFKNFKIIPNVDTKKKELFTASLDDIKMCEEKLNINFEEDYKDYVLKYGRGILGGTYIRIYLPQKIENEISEWKERIDKYWFWDEGKEILTKQNALNFVIIGDTFDGDEIIYHDNFYFILPRYQEMIYKTGKTLEETIDWLCTSGTLTEAFNEREFEPF